MFLLTAEAAHLMIRCNGMQLRFFRAALVGGIFAAVAERAALRQVQQVGHHTGDGVQPLGILANARDGILRW